MRRIIFTVTLLLCLLYLRVYAASPKLTVEIPDRGVLIGNQYHVTVSISDNPGFASLQLELFYNDQTMKCVKVIPGEVIKSMMTSTNPCAAGDVKSALLSAAGSSDTTANGTLATFVFEKPKNGDPAFNFRLSEIRTSRGSKVQCEAVVNNKYGSLAELPDEPSQVTPPQTEDNPNKPGQGSVTPPNTGQIPTNPTFPTFPGIPSVPTLPSIPQGNSNNNITTDLPEIHVQIIPDGTRSDDIGEIVEQDKQDDSKTDDKHNTYESLPDAFSDTPLGKAAKFTDVTQSHWAKTYIDEATARGVISGYPDGTFLPDKEMNRAEFATMLWNMAGKPKTRANLPFADVTIGDWYYNQIAWAYENGYIAGVTEKEFRPMALVTREQAMTILYRYASNPDAGYAMIGYTDVADISSYAVHAMNWAVDAGIISGVDQMRLAPKANATRAQLSTIIVRYIHYIQNYQQGE